MRRELGDPVFDAWIGPLSLESFDKDELKIGAAKPFVRNWVANHYVARIERAFRAEGAEPASLSIVMSAAPAPVGRRRRGARAQPPTAPASVSYLPPRAQAARTTTQGPVEPHAASPADLRQLHSRPRQRVRPWRGAARFAEGQQSDIPLLYIHGGFGFGKTHLLNAAALEFRKRGKRTLFLRAEDFMRHFLGALYRKDTLAFKEELRTAEVLIIDDLQHICRSHRHGVGVPLHRQRLCRPAPPGGDRRRPRARRRWKAWAPTSSRAWPAGLCIALDKPDRDTRLAILKSRAAEFAATSPMWCCPEAVLERIADLDDASPRELIGVFTKLATYADLTKKPVTLETAEEAVGLRAGPGAKTSIEDIQRKTAEFYKLDVKDFHSPSAPAGWPGRARWRCICRAS